MRSQGKNILLGGENNQVWLPNMRIPAFYQIKTKMHFYNLAPICSLCPKQCLRVLFFLPEAILLKMFLPGMYHAQPISSSSQTISESNPLEQKSDSDFYSLCLPGSKYPTPRPCHLFFPLVIRSLCTQLVMLLIVAKCNPVSLPAGQVPCKNLT